MATKKPLPLKGNFSNEGSVQSDDNTGGNPGIEPRPISSKPFIPDIVLNSTEQNVLLEIDSQTAAVLNSRFFHFTYFNEEGDPVTIEGYGRLTFGGGPKARIDFLSGKNAQVNATIWTSGPNKGRGQASVIIGKIGQEGYRRWHFSDLDASYPE